MICRLVEVFIDGAHINYIKLRDMHVISIWLEILPGHYFGRLLKLMVNLAVLYSGSWASLMP